MDVLDTLHNAIVNDKLNDVKILIENKINPYDKINNMNLIEYSEKFGSNNIINYLQNEYGMQQNEKYDCIIL